MKVPKEYTLLAIIGLFLLAYLLDSVVDPLRLKLITPYHYFVSENVSKYPFSTTSILIKSIAIFISPLWLLSFFSGRGFGKPIILFLVSVLLQLYALQDIATNSSLVPQEWSLAFALGGLLLFAPTIIYTIQAIVFSAHQNLTNVKMEEAIKKAQEEKKAAQSESE